MQAVFYTFNKRVNSTKRPIGEGQTYDIQLKDEVGLVRPSIILNLSAVVNPTAYNYCYIAEFSRYYFVSDWGWERGLWTAYLEIDVLATWKEQIGASSEYIARSSAVSDGNIVDNLYPMTGEIVVQNTNIDTIWNRATYNPTLPNAGFYVVGVIGNDQVTYWMMTVPVFEMFMNGLYSTAYVTSITTTITQSTNEILTAINPLQYINSIRWYPFLYSGEIDPANYVNDVPVGWGSVSLANSAYKLPVNYLEVVKSVSIPSHPQASSRGNYMNKGQFTSRSLFYPPFGVIGLDPDKVAYADSLELLFRVDFRSGDCYLTVYAVKNGNNIAVLAHVSAQGSSDCLRAGITNNQWSAYEELEVGLGFAASTARRAADVLSGPEITRPGIALGAGLDAVATVAESAADAMQLQGERSKAAYPILSVTGTDGAVAAFVGTPTLTSVFHMAVNDDNAQRGRPLCDIRMISTIPGYIVVSDPDIALPSTAAENSAVKAYMANGFFYE